MSLSHSEPVGWPPPKVASPLLLLGLSDNLLLKMKLVIGRMGHEQCAYFEDKLELEELPEFAAIP